MEKEFLKAVHDYQRIIHKLCRIYRDTPEDQEDLFQEIVIQLWKAFPKFRGESKFSTWLYRIGINVAITQYRKHKNRIYETDIESLKFELPADELSLEQEEQLQQMYSAISQLNDIEKAIVMLYLEDRSYDEMEEIMGISNGNLRVRMNRIKEKLRQITKTT